MIIELGHFSLILALFVSFIQAIIPLHGAKLGDISLMFLAKPATFAHFLLMTLAFGTLVYAYIVSDFSVYTVAKNSHTMKPLLYKITGVWANHEGSLVLWVTVLSVFSIILAWNRQVLPLSLRTRVLSVQAMIAFGFLLFILLTSNPFQRLSPPVIEGHGLNPLLQDPGLACHPPMLYLGYVGFSVSFSFAIAALIEGQIDSLWAHWVRPWVLTAWIFLTLGIALGSWWAYYELGWGGWWFWDPVENAALIPWLSGTALLHSVIVVEKCDSLKRWTVLLAIITFSLSLLGTFLVRSGILTSVHAFTVDPARGVFILGLLSITVGSSLLLFAVKAQKIQGDHVLFAIISREGSLLLNSALLLVIAATVLLGTIYPLISDAFSLGKLSVGAPFFNYTVIPLMVPLVAVMASGPLLPWKYGKIITVVRLSWPAMLIASLTAASVAHKTQRLNLLTGASAGLAAWLSLATLTILVKKRFHVLDKRQSSGKIRYRDMSLTGYGMVLSHLGLAILMAGAVAMTAWETEKIVTLHTGETTELTGYTFELTSVETTQGPNYQAIRGTITILRSGIPISMLFPERRQYINPVQLTTEAAIYTTGFIDLYTALGESDPVSGKATLRLYYKPLAPWLWYGAGLMVLGGLASLIGKQHHKK